MPKRILIVDDEPDLLKMVEFRLKIAGYTVSTAKDGEEGLRLIRNDPPDLVLLDIRLPKMDGGEVCKCMKSDEKLRTIPIILFTASGAERILEKVKETGADDYLMKPFDGEDLLRRIKKLTG